MATATTQLDTQAGRGAPRGYAARAKWATVVLETGTGTYVGRLYIPDGKRRVSDVLCDNRPFLNVAEVTAGDTGEVMPFLAINKSAVLTVRVIDEGSADVIPIHARG